ncbi:hypothetical protein PSY31_23055, partial [Shigella flexneri]|nr:hypothetical protein [Shigella flexneri]
IYIYFFKSALQKKGGMWAVVPLAPFALPLVIDYKKYINFRFVGFGSFGPLVFGLFFLKNYDERELFGPFFLLYIDR